MPDSREPNPMPDNWARAFSALPMEAPATDAWPSLARRLPQPSVRGIRASGKTRNRRLHLAALAATLVLAAVIPALIRHADDASLSTLPREPVAEANRPVKIAPAAPPADTPAIVAPASTADLVLAKEKTTGVPAHAVRSASAHGLRRMSKTASASSRVEDARLDALHARSAELEAALAEMHQPPNTNQGIEVISQHFARMIGTIDQTLSEGNPDERETLALWRQRNRFLGQMLEIETRNQQLLAQRTTSPFEFSVVN